MAGASKPEPVTGRSGRRYEPSDDAAAVRIRRARLTRAVIATGSPRGDSMVSDGTPVAVFGPVAGADPSWAPEVALYQRLSTAVATPPCPRVFDAVQGGEGLITEWCPVDLETWWAGVMNAEEATRGLLQAITECCRRVDDYTGLVEDGAPSPQIRPRAIVRRSDGRWLLGRFGDPVVPTTAEAPFDEALLFTPPEQLFGAQNVDRGRAAVWGLGCTMLVLLRMRALRRKGASLPPEGSDSAVLRSHRATLVADLFRQKPALFRGRALDPRQFLYPDVLPEPDQTIIGEAIRGDLLDPTAEAALQQRLAALIERCLVIDPAARFQSPAELATQIDSIIRWFRDTRQEMQRMSQVRPAPIVPATPEPSPEPAPARRPSPLDETERTLLLERIQTLETRLDAMEGRKLPSLLPMWGVIVLLLLAQGYTLSQMSSPSTPPPPVQTPAPASTVPTPEPAPAPSPEPEPVPAAPVVQAPPPAARPAPSGSGGIVVEEPAEVIVENGSVRVIGIQGAYLLSDGSRLAPGAVPPGSYTVFGSVDGAAPARLGEVVVSPGERVTFRCGFGTCRVE